MYSGKGAVSGGDFSQNIFSIVYSTLPQYWTNLLLN